MPVIAVCCEANPRARCDGQSSSGGNCDIACYEHISHPTFTFAYPAGLGDEIRHIHGESNTAITVVGDDPQAIDIVSRGPAASVDTYCDLIGLRGGRAAGRLDRNSGGIGTRRPGQGARATVFDLDGEFRQRTVEVKARQ